MVNIKALTRKRYFVIGLALFLVALLIFFFIPKGTIYLYTNQVQVDASDGDYSFNSLSGHIEGKKMILTGESHGSETNYLLKLHLFKYLVNNHNFTHFIDETGRGTGYLINQYIQTGNRTLLDFVFRSYEFTSANAQENYEFFVQLHELYEQTKFEFTGMDIEHRIDMSILAVNEIFKSIPDNQSDISLVRDVKRLSAILVGLDLNYSRYTTSVWSEIFDTFDRLKVEVNSSSSNLVDILTSNYFEFVEVVNNGVNGVSFSEMRQNNNIEGAMAFREEVITDNILDHYSYQSASKYFGQWGNAHVLQRPLNLQNYQTSFATELDKNPEFQDAIYSILLYYIGSHGITTQGGEWREIGINNRPPFRFNALAEWVFRDDVTIVNLDEKDSPFAETTLLLDQPASNQLVTTDYFQSLVVVKGSSSVERYPD